MNPDFRRVCREYDIDNYEDIPVKMQLKVVELFEKGVICEEEETYKGKYYNFVALYYRYKIKNYDEMKKYYLMAIDKGNPFAMNNLGYYYQHIETDYDEMKKYYLMAIKKGHAFAMCHLGFYYQNIEKNYDEMKKYYSMAIEKGNSNAMNNLGYHYQNIEKNYDEMKKYYLMAIEKGHALTMYNLGLYYQNVEKNYDKARYWYIKSIKHQQTKYVFNRLKYILNNNIEYFFILRQLRSFNNPKVFEELKKLDQENGRRGPVFKEELMTKTLNLDSLILKYNDTIMHQDLDAEDSVIPSDRVFEIDLERQAKWKEDIKQELKFEQYIKRGIIDYISYN